MTIGQYINKLRVLHWAMSIGVVMMFGVIMYLRTQKLLPLLEDETLESVLIVIGIAFSFSIISAAFFMFHSMTSRLDERLPLPQKLEAFMKFYILRLAMVEAANLFILLAYMMTMATVALIIWQILMLILMMLYPSKKEMSKVLRLNESDSLTLEQDSAVLNFGVHPIFKDRLN